MGYDAFISYSHGSDLDLARVTRDGLQKLAKPWNRRRALDIFLDQSSLELSSELGSSLDDRIEDTDWLVLFMSEVSADSKWVKAEISEWVEAKSKDRMALVLTSGEIEWDDEAQDFDYEKSTAVNEGMRGVYTGQDSEPLYLDMRWTKEVPDGEASLGLDDVRFRDAIATISAAIQGKSKDEVEGDDIRAHRRMVRIRRIAVTALVILTVAAVIAGIVAFIQRQQAIEEADRATSRALASDSQTNVEAETDLAALLALESVRVANTPDARGSLARVLSSPTHFLQREHVHDATVTAITFSSDGRFAATGDSFGLVHLWMIDEDPFAAPQAEVTETEIQLATAVEELYLEVDEAGGYFGAFDSAGNLVVQDLSTGGRLDIPPPQDFIALAVTPGEESLIAGLESDGFVRVYELNDELGYERRGELSLADALPDVDIPTILDLLEEQELNAALAFSTDGKTVALGLETDLVVWDWENPTGLRRSTGFETEVISVAFGPDEKLEEAVIAVGERRGNIWLYDRSNLELRYDLDPALFNAPIDLAFRPTADEFGEFPLASAHSNGEIILWSVLPADGESTPFGYEVESMTGHRDEAWSIAFSPTNPGGDLSRIASGDFEGEVIFWVDQPVSRLGTGSFVPGDDPPALNDVAFVSSTHVVAADANGIGWTWDISEPGIEPEEAASGVSAIDAAANSVAALLDDGMLAIYDLDKNGTALGLQDDDASYVSISDSGNTVVTASARAPVGITIWNVPEDSSIAEVNLPETFTATSLLATDDAIWVGGADVAENDSGLPTVLKLDSETGEILGTIQHSTRSGNSVDALALSDDGKLLATGGGDRKIVLWDTQTLDRESQEFSGHRGIVSGIAFWDDGATLISADWAGEILIWDVSEQRLFGVLAGPTRAIVALEANDESKTLLAASGDAKVWTWTLDPSSWRALTCQLAARNMTEAEWELYGSGGTRVRHCPDNDIDEGAYRDATYGEALTD